MELADKMNVNRVTLNRTINNNPTYETLKNIATALDVDIKDLFESTKMKSSEELIDESIELLKKAKTKQ